MRGMTARMIMQEASNRKRVGQNGRVLIVTVFLIQAQHMEDIGESIHRDSNIQKSQRRTDE